jgi:hypothetical protein
MAGNEITLTFGGDARALSQATQRATADVTGMADACASTATDFDEANKSGGRLGDGIGRLGGAAAGMSSALEDAGGSLTALDDVMNMARNRAAAQARALIDVEQVSNDLEQAYGDLRQAQLDLNQSMIDGKQANLDAKQAQIDAQQAVLDASEAQKAYNEAVKEHGAGSAEARQAAIDLTQAQADLGQANLDAEQAANDYKQATEDGGQAQRDAKQAAIDAKSATLDLADAQREAHPEGLAKWGKTLETVTPLIMGIIGATNLLALANDMVSLSWIRQTAASVGAKIATAAGAVVTGIATAAQWLWNVAMMANPLGLIIAGIVLLVGVIILIATKTTWFQDLWTVCWKWIKDAASATWDWLVGMFHGMVGWFQKIPGMLKSAFSGLVDIITWPYRTAFNLISTIWNATIGKLSWTVPSWVPVVGGMTVSAPKLPKFHRGGTVPGTPGSEMLAVLQAGETVTPAGQGGGGRTVIELRGDGTPLGELLVQILANAVRIRGGDVQVVLGG